MEAEVESLSVQGEWKSRLMLFREGLRHRYNIPIISNTCTSLFAIENGVHYLRRILGWAFSSSF